MSPAVQSRPYTDVSELFYRGGEYAHKTVAKLRLQTRLRDRATLLPGEERVEGLKVEVDPVKQLELDVPSPSSPLHDRLVLFGGNWPGRECGFG